MCFLVRYNTTKERFFGDIANFYQQNAFISTLFSFNSIKTFVRSFHTLNSKRIFFNFGYSKLPKKPYFVIIINKYFTTSIFNLTKTI